MHIAIETKIRQTLVIEVTKEDVGNGKMFVRLLKNSASIVSIKRVIGEGAYDSASSFLRTSKMGVDALIRVRLNSSLKSRKHMSC